jgi:hypothetical protein
VCCLFHVLIFAAISAIDALSTGRLDWRVLCERLEQIGRFEATPDKNAHVTSWTEAVSDALLVQFGLKDAGSTYALAGHCAAETKARLAAAGCAGYEVNIACRDELLPYPIVVACIAVPDAPQVYFPLEFTPQYSGVPTRVDSVLPNGRVLRLGGVFQQPFATLCDAPTASAWSAAAVSTAITADVSLALVPPPCYMAGLSSRCVTVIC